jgi:hypothetical protein
MAVVTLVVAAGAVVVVGAVLALGLLLAAAAVRGRDRRAARAADAFSGLHAGLDALDRIDQRRH